VQLPVRDLDTGMTRTRPCDDGDDRKARFSPDVCRRRKLAGIAPITDNKTPVTTFVVQRRRRVRDVQLPFLKPYRHIADSNIIFPTPTYSYKYRRYTSMTEKIKRNSNV